ncbi:hypothetical protein GTH32_12015 [Alteromonas sp. 345S023]|uniref:Uncharacterized protein n=1 Tax=Alteromonas profundi TaxID=2696062 RepID=A0A7X5LM69_9ALTE|nr:hypothetical protein [Alteromonas profundi]NDV91902.1 hypothetical protein [Alteromonas profundi]
MRRFSVLLVTLLSLLGINAANANIDCALNPQALKATYQVATTKGTKRSSPTTLVLWRDGDKVAHQYPQTNITETWHLIRNRHIKTVRYFDAHERAIEYQPNERIHGHVEKDFSYRYQLISDSVLARMVKQPSTGDTPANSCYTEIKMTLEENGQHIALTWLPALRLIKDFQVTGKGMKREWQLTSLAHHSQGNNRDKNIDQGTSQAIDTKAFFAQREAYQTTDYADIGDDHTDPFLTKMVHQGFIEAGASGFYHQDGRAIEGQHTH